MISSRSFRQVFSKFFILLHTMQLFLTWFSYIWTIKKGIIYSYIHHHHPPPDSLNDQELLKHGNIFYRAEFSEQEKRIH